MTRDEHRAECIEAQAQALYELDPIEAGGEYVDGFQVTPSGILTWAQAVKCGFVTEYFRKAAIIFDSLHGVARVDPIEATEEMLHAGHQASALTGPRSWRAMSSRGDLTNPPEEKL